MSLEEAGFEIVDRLFSGEECDAILGRLATLDLDSAGTRRLLDVEWCRSVANEVRTRLGPRFGFVESLAAVQCTYFQKSDEINWLVPWHQDLTIPVLDKVPSNELEGWSRKEGVTFVRAPESVLRSLLGVRLSLDASTPENGPLRVVAGSHQQGVLEPDRIELLRQSQPETLCSAERGSAVLLRPLLLHASSRSASRMPRRVLHLVFEPASLPFGLKWRFAC